MREPCRKLGYLRRRHTWLVAVQTAVQKLPCSCRCILYSSNFTCAIAFQLIFAASPLDLHKYRTPPGCTIVVTLEIGIGMSPKASSVLKSS